MTERKQFTFDKKISNRNKVRRFWRILLFLWSIYLIMFLSTTFLKLQFEDSSYIELMYSIFSSPYFGSSFLLTPIILLFVKPGPIQTITITSDTIQIEQNQDAYKIDKSSISAIEETDDAVIIKVGKQKYRLSRDLADFEELLDKLTESKTIDKRNFRPYLFASGLAVIFFGYFFGILYLFQTQLYWLIWILQILLLGILGVFSFRYWKKPPFVNNDKQNIKKQLKISLILIALGSLLILILILYLFISYRWF